MPRWITPAFTVGIPLTGMSNFTIQLYEGSNQEELTVKEAPESYGKGWFARKNDITMDYGRASFLLGLHWENNKHRCIGVLMSYGDDGTVSRSCYFSDPFENVEDKNYYSCLTLGDNAGGFDVLADAFVSIHKNAIPQNFRHGAPNRDNEVILCVAGMTVDSL